MHRHKAIPSQSRDLGWCTCVTPQQCAAHPGRQAAHGGIVQVDYCRCGAIRESESNGGITNYGPWRAAAELVELAMRAILRDDEAEPFVRPLGVYQQWEE